MPTSDKDVEEILVDTSVAIALAVTDHDEHEPTTMAVADRRLGLAGHAAFETFSVLTRLPPPARRSPEAVTELLRVGFPATRYLSREGAAGLVDRLVASGFAGGAIYDALVGATAVEHGLRLLSRDRRALGCYRALGVDVELIAPVTDN